MTNEDIMLQGKDPRFSKMFAKKSSINKEEQNVSDKNQNKGKAGCTLDEVETILDQTKVKILLAIYLFRRYSTCLFPKRTTLAET